MEEKVLVKGAGVEKSSGRACMIHRNGLQTV